MASLSSPDKMSSSLRSTSGKGPRKKRSTRSRGDGPLRLSLSYTEMCLNSEGAVMPKEQIKELRIRQGFCPTCLGEPVRLFDIQRSRFNPLLSSKEPRNIEGECYNGHCLHCFPEQSPHCLNRSLSQTISDRKVDTDGSITRPLANRMTSTSRSGGFDSLANQNGEDNVMRSPGKNVDGMNDAADTNGDTPKTKSKRTLMRSVTVRMTKTMTTLAEYTRSSSTQEEDEASLSDEGERDFTRVDIGHDSIRSLERQSATRRASSFAFDDEDDSDIAEDHANEDDGDPSRKETKTGIPVPPRASKRLSGRSSGSTLEDMYQQCRRDSRTRSTRRSTLIELDLSTIDFGDIDDSEDEEEQSDVPPRPQQERSLSVRYRHETDSPPPPPLGRNSSTLSERSGHDTDPAPPHPPQLRQNSSTISESTPVRAPSRSVTFNDGGGAITLQEEGNNEIARTPEQIIEDTVAELDTLVKDLASTGNPDFAVDVLTDAMKSHPKAEAIQVFCLGTIWNFCKTNNAIKESVISSSAPEDTLLAMKEHLSSALVQERGCGIMRALSVSSKNRLVLMQAGAIPRILRALEEHPNDEHVVATAVGALRTLSPESRVREAYLSLDVKLIVVNAMELHRLVESIQRDGIVLLSNTAIEVDGAQVAAVPTEELEAIVQAMRAHQTNMSVKSVVSVACFALKNFSYDERNVRTLLQLSDARPLLEMAAERSVDPACRNDASITLEKLLMMDAMESSRRDHLKQELSGDLGEVSIDDAMKTIRENAEPVDVMECALESVRKLASSSESSQTQIAESEGLEKIVAVMKKHEQSPTVQIEGCRVFECFVNSALDVIDAGACAAILCAMEVHSSNAAVLIAAFKALKVLSVHFECWFELEQAGLMEMFRDAFHQNQDSETVQHEGTEILMNFSAYSG